MYEAILLIVSAAPGVLFLMLIMRMDREEPEPLSLVLRVIALGAGSAIVASLVEMALDVVPLFRSGDAAGVVASSFLQVAPVEELCKLGVVLLFVWRNPNFNEENDGIVYVGASAIGFAVLENVMYVFQTGIDTGIVRAFTAIPLHVFTAVIMGLFVGRAKFADSAARRNRLIIAGFAIAWFMHGLYDTLAEADSGVPLLILPLVAGAAGFGIMALKKGRKLSLRRWEGMSAFFKPVPEERRTRRPAPRWMPIVSRILLIGSGIVLAFLIIGVFLFDTAETVWLAIIGGLYITFIPLCIGIVMEVVYRRWRRREVESS